MKPKPGSKPLSNEALIDLMREVYRYADLFSDDPSTQNAAFILRGRDVVARGANRYPLGSLDDELLEQVKSDRERKLTFIEHAERAAIYDAAHWGEATRDTTMVCPWACCPPCARAIEMSGITRVVAHAEAIAKSPERWKQAIEDGRRILANSKVEFTLLEAEIGNIKNLFNGEVWYP